MLITNGTIITWEQPNRILEDQALTIKDGRIVEMGPQKELLERYPARAKESRRVFSQVNYR
jgi:predicted amidohydrolase YtcJ